MNREEWHVTVEGGEQLRYTRWIDLLEANHHRKTATEWKYYNKDWLMIEWLLFDAEQGFLTAHDRWWRTVDRDGTVYFRNPASYELICLEGRVSKHGQIRTKS